MSSSSLSKTPIVGIGAGGHCKVLLDLLDSLGVWRVVGLLDVDPLRIGKTVGGVSVLGGDHLAKELWEQGVHAAFLGMGSVGATQPRSNSYTMLREIGFDLPRLIHPRAYVGSDITFEEGSCVMAGALVQTGTTVGRCVIVNTGAIIEHDCSIADFAHIAPGAVLGGGVQVGKGSHVGIGAVIRQGIRIGAHVMIGAGAVVVKDIPDGTTVVGVPASPRTISATHP